MTIKDILEHKITDIQRAQLMYAFEHNLAQFIEFERGKFVGVNTEYIKHLYPETIIGKWSTGIIRGK